MLCPVGKQGEKEQNAIKLPFQPCDSEGVWLTRFFLLPKLSLKVYTLASIPLACSPKQAITFCMQYVAFR